MRSLTFWSFDHLFYNFLESRLAARQHRFITKKHFQHCFSSSSTTPSSPSFSRHTSFHPKRFPSRITITTRDSRSSSCRSFGDAGPVPRNACFLGRTTVASPLRLCCKTRSPSTCLPCHALLHALTPYHLRHFLTRLIGLRETD